MHLTKVGILTVSDRCFSGAMPNLSGTTIQSSIETGILGDGFKVVQSSCVPDEVSNIQDTLISWCDESKLDLILTTGGTGVAPRDITPEVTRAVIEKEVPGVSIAIILRSLEVTPMAMLSRLVCGIRKNTLIVNFPGSVNGCTTSLSVIKPVITHALDLLKNRKDQINKVHCMSKTQSKVNKECVAKRDRKSPYPLIDFAKAQKIILQTVASLPDVSMASKAAMGYSLSYDIHAPENFPPVPSSIKDGYAVIASDGAGIRRVARSFLAGDDSIGFRLESGLCARITTGAPVPDGANAVVQVEDTIVLSAADNEQTEVEIEILKPPTEGQDIRPVGSDIPINSVLIKAGSALTPYDIALLASAGINNVVVTRKPKIAVLSTGNELLNPEETLIPGKIRDSNKVMLMKLLEKHGYAAIDCGITPDEPEAILSKVEHALSVADILISTGGVSMGEKDLLTDVLVEDLQAKLHFGRINMKPGKPTKFFSVRSIDHLKFIFALPGNPVSAAVTFRLFVLPALRRLSNIEPALPKLIRVKIDKEIRLDERAEFARASLDWDEEGVAYAKFTGNQISSRLLNMVDSECLLHLPPASECVPNLPPSSVVNAELM